MIQNFRKDGVMDQGRLSWVHGWVGHSLKQEHATRLARGTSDPILSFIIRRGGGMNTRVSFVFVGGGECRPPNYSRYSRVIRGYSPDSRA